MNNKVTYVFVAALIGVAFVALFTKPGGDVIRRAVPGGDTGSGDRPHSPGKPPPSPQRPGGSGGSQPGPIIDLDPSICLPPIVTIGGC